MSEQEKKEQKDEQIQEDAVVDVGVDYNELEKHLTSLDAGKEPSDVLEDDDKKKKEDDEIVDQLKDKEEPKKEVVEDPATTQIPQEKQTKTEEVVEEDKPSPKEYAEFRIQNKKNEQEIADLKTKLQELEQSSQKAAQTSAEPEDVADRVIGLMLRAQEGELTSDELGRLGTPEYALQQCKRALFEEVSSAELRDLFAKAENNAFGDRSEEIANIAAKYLPVAESRESAEFRRSETERITKDNKANEFVQNRQEELAKVAQDFPDFNVADSAQNKYLAEWVKKNVGSISTEGSVSGDGLLPKDVAQGFLDHPYELVKFVNSEFSNSPVHAELESAREKLKEYEKKLHLSDALPSGSPAVSPDQKGEQTADDIELELERMSRKIEASKMS